MHLALQRLDVPEFVIQEGSGGKGWEASPFSKEQSKEEKGRSLGGGTRRRERQISYVKFIN